MQNNKITLATPVTHIDWVWKYFDRIGHGPESVRHILDRCKEIGWTRVYWRCLDGGRAHFKSKLMDGPATGYEPDNWHKWGHEAPPEWHKSDDQLPDIFRQYADFDDVAEAVRYGHSIGLEIHAWVSINEDDHAWGLISRFSKENPQYRWVKRSGLPYNSQLSFAFQEVRQYKLELLKEILTYDIDGVFFDWLRTGDMRNEPQATPDGTADFGYEKPLVAAFEKQYGLSPTQVRNYDERWVKLRAEPQTAFMRAAHKLIKGKSSSLAISYLGHSPWSFRGATPTINGNLNGLLVDLKTWAQEGLVDEVVSGGYYTDGTNVETAYQHLQAEVGDYCKPWMYAWVPDSVQRFHDSIRMAEKLGTHQILYWESDYIEMPDRRDDSDLHSAMNGYAYQSSHNNMRGNRM